MTTPEQLGGAMQDTPFDTEGLMQDITHLALAESQGHTPVRKGLLRRSETTRIEAKGLRGFLGTNVVYGPFVHNGTRFMAAQPFFAEGITAATPAIVRRLAAAGDAYLAQFGDI